MSVRKKTAKTEKPKAKALEKRQEKAPKVKKEIIPQFIADIPRKISEDAEKFCVENIKSQGLKNQKIYPTRFCTKILIGRQKPPLITVFAHIIYRRSPRKTVKLPRELKKKSILWQTAVCPFFIWRKEFPY